jgi:hypothetical protein
VALPQRTRSRGFRRSGSGTTHVTGRRASSLRKRAKAYQARIFVGTVKLNPSRIIDSRANPMSGSSRRRATAPIRRGKFRPLS